MEPKDLKELAWQEYGQAAYEAEMRLREVMEQGDAPCWPVLYAEQEQNREGGDHE